MLCIDLLVRTYLSRLNKSLRFVFLRARAIQMGVSHPEQCHLAPDKVNLTDESQWENVSNHPLFVEVILWAIESCCPAGS